MERVAAEAAMVAPAINLAISLAEIIRLPTNRAGIIKETDKQETSLAGEIILAREDQDEITTTDVRARQMAPTQRVLQIRLADK